MSRTALGAHASVSAQADAAAVLDTIYARGVRFQAPDVARSRSHAGDPARLHRVMAKLLRGARAAALPCPPACGAPTCLLACSSCHQAARCPLQRPVLRLPSKPLFGTAGEPISVLILGGSIEAGAALASPPDSYFVRPTAPLSLPGCRHWQAQCSHVPALFTDASTLCRHKLTQGRCAANLHGRCALLIAIHMVSG